MGLLDFGKAAWREITGGEGSLIRKAPGADAILRNTRDHLGKGLEGLAKGVYWLYSEAVSQPLSTVVNQFDKAGLGALTSGWGGITDVLSGNFDDLKPDLSKVGNLFDTDSWGESYKQAEHISPGQAGWLASMSDSDAQELRNNPMRLREYFSSGPQKWGSGVTDFAVSWFADPTVVGLKGVKAASALSHVKSGQNIEKSMNSSTVNRLVEWTNGKSAEEIGRLDSMRKSYNGPLLSHLLANAGDEMVKKDILRVSLGDAEAMSNLRLRRADLAESIAYANERYSAIGNSLTTLKKGSIEERLALDLKEKTQASLRQMDREYGDITNRMAVYRTMDDLHTGAFTRGAADLRHKFKMADKMPVKTGRTIHDVVHNNLYSRPLRIARAMGDKRPNNWVDLNSVDSVVDVEAYLNRVRGLTPAEKSEMLSAYAGITSKAERGNFMKAIEVRSIQKMAERYGLQADDAMELYKQFDRAREGMRSQLGESFSAARYENAQGDLVRVDDFGDAGEAIMLHPNLRTKLQTHHQSMDLDYMERILKVHGSSIGTIRKGLYAGEDIAVALGDAFNTAWKLGVLARLGYPIRAVGDGLLSQTARFGAFAMMGQMANGIGRFAMNNMRFSKHAMAKFKGEYSKLHIKDLQDDVAYLGKQLAEYQVPKNFNRDRFLNQGDIGPGSAVRDLQGKTPEGLGNLAPQQVRIGRSKSGKPIMGVREGKVNQPGGGIAPEAIKADKVNPAMQGPKDLAKTADQLGALAAHQVVVGWSVHGTPIVSDIPSKVNVPGGGKAAVGDKPSKLKEIREDRYEDLVSQYESARAQLGKAQAGRTAKFEREHFGDQPVRSGWDGVEYPAAFAGKEGQLYRSLADSSSSQAQVFKDYADGQHAIQRSGNWRIMSAAEDPAKHLAAWHDDIMKQIAQDTLGKKILAGMTKRDIVRWFGTAEGRAYRADMGIKNFDPEDFVARAAAEVDHYLPPQIPELRELALGGKLTPRDLDAAVDVRIRPDVHSQQLEHNFGKGLLARKADQAVTGFYKYFASMPENVLSRHPLYDRLYRGHIADMSSKLGKQGYTPMKSDIDEIAHMARVKALKDLKRYAFDITHKSEAAHALRFMFPFMAAAQEGWVRWARTVYDKPETLGHVGRVYQVPERMGIVSDRDGNKVNADGTVTMPDGSKRLVPKSERMVTLRVPSYMKGVPGLGDDFKIPKDSANLVLQGDPWWNPGTGPLLQIPVNEIVLHKPEYAEIAKDAGILPFGPTTKRSDMVLPTAIKAAMNMRESDEDFQNQLMIVMASEDAKFKNGQRATPPTWDEVTKKAKNFFGFKVVTSLALPISATKADPLQFFRDEYRKMLDVDPGTADQEFYNKYGPSLYAITASLTKNTSGIPATLGAVAKTKEFAPLIADAPELGWLIVGPVGSEKYNAAAKEWQENTSVTSGDPTKHRTKMTAREAMAENRRDLGWKKYNQMLLSLSAKLIAEGDPNSEDKMKTIRKAVASIYTDPNSEHYIEEFAEDYSTFNREKYDQLIPKLAAIAENPAFEKDPTRTDIMSLRKYLIGRNAVLALLEQRKSQNLGANSNAGLAEVWGKFVSELKEQDTRFEELHNRLLSRDLGIDTNEEEG